MNSSSPQTAVAGNKSITECAELGKIIRKMSPEMLRVAAETDSTDRFPSKTFEELAKAGLLAAVIPGNCGGAGIGTDSASTFELLTILKNLGYGNLVVGRIFEGHFNAWQLIGEFGASPRKEKLANEARQKNHLFGVWNTEAGDGVQIIPQVNDKFILKGAKTFASGVGFVNRPIVTGKLPDGGWQMFVVPLDEVRTTIDDSWWKPLGMQASRSYRVDFSGVEISSENFIGKPNDYYRQPFFNGGAIRFAAVQLGAAELLLDLTRKFLQELKRTDDGFQQMRLGQMAIAVETGNLWLKTAAKTFDGFLVDKNQDKNDQVIHYAGMMRTAIEEICRKVMQLCENSIGSRGLLKPYHFERVIRDLTMYLRQAAPDATLCGIGNFILKSDQTFNDLWNVDER